MKKMNWEYLGAFMDGEGCIVKNITLKIGWTSSVDKSELG